MATKEEILEVLSGVEDPELRRNLVELGMVRNLKIEEGHVAFDLALTTLACPLKDQLVAQAREAAFALDGVAEVDVGAVEMSDEEVAGVMGDNLLPKDYRPLEGETIKVLAVIGGGGRTSDRELNGGDVVELYPMLSVEEALERVLAAFEPLPAERVSVLETLGRVLAEDIYADMDIPPLTNSAMDGYAVRAAETAGASPQQPVRLHIVYDLAAGYTTDVVVTPGTAIRIMTGAPVPPGADAVVRFEDTERDGEWVKVLKGVGVNKNVRHTGEDVKQGTLILPRGTVIRPQEVGMLAALGHKDALVHRQPRVAVLATGDEVIQVDAPWQPGKIRNANSYSNAAQVLKYGGIPVMLGIARDHPGKISAKIREALDQEVDLIITSGGVSVGDFDVVKEVLGAKGKMEFWRVQMKPGKPLAFGRVQGVPLLGMPGNPVAAMISFELFARPAILRMLGRLDLEKPTIEATLVDEVRRKDNRRHFLRVTVERRKGESFARLTGEQGSGILFSMVKADGLAIIPEERNHLEAGDRVKVMMLDWPEERTGQGKSQ